MKKFGKVGRTYTNMENLGEITEKLLIVQKGVIKVYQSGSCTGLFTGSSDREMSDAVRLTQRLDPVCGELVVIT